MTLGVILVGAGLILVWAGWTNRPVGPMLLGNYPPKRGMGGLITSGGSTVAIPPGVVQGTGPAFPGGAPPGPTGPMR